MSRREDVLKYFYRNKDYTDSRVKSGIELYHTDSSHPSYAGSFLIAAGFFARIFGTSPEDIPYTGELDENTAKILKKTAAILLLRNPDLPSVTEFEKLS